VSIGTENVLLGVLLELNSILGLLIFLMEEVSDTMFELLESVVLLDSFWVIIEVISHDEG
jgi:hypothetical protein